MNLLKVDVCVCVNEYVYSVGQNWVYSCESVKHKVCPCSIIY